MIIDAKVWIPSDANNGMVTLVLVHHSFILLLFVFRIIKVWKTGQDFA